MDKILRKIFIDNDSASNRWQKACTSYDVRVVQEDTRDEIVPSCKSEEE